MSRALPSDVGHYVRRFSYTSCHEVKKFRETTDEQTRRWRVSTEKFDRYYVGNAADSVGLSRRSRKCSRKIVYPRADNNDTLRGRGNEANGQTVKRLNAIRRRFSCFFLRVRGYGSRRDTNFTRNVLDPTGPRLRRYGRRWKA